MFPIFSHNPMRGKYEKAGLKKELSSKLFLE